MTINDQIRDEKPQYDINRKVAEYQLYQKAELISMNILLVKKHYHLIKITERAKFTYSPLGKAYEKQIKTIEIKEKTKRRL